MNDLICLLSFFPLNLYASTNIAQDL